ncbi:hypothetical protein BECAL_02024 [Bellilinea caldifistulae]|uniref:Uncharacterized protein n=1 Tax=Bellilinea caldifistulae TaxID=360411 RepID=A0A0N8GLG7_9CHLR|nr:hypothetical protein [Bellilinea caldifistulae]KPL72450.1 hypothetical protein AC812_15655 [Bellilinea caldifistulae]GAP10848.1 hypothetical protein BECAL_02024 [Bellilinea caldifistulae]
MMTSETNLQQQLKQMVIKQKTTHLESPDDHLYLTSLYQLLHQYEEHVSKLVIQALQGSGEYTPFGLMDLLLEEFKKAEARTNSESQRLLHQYRLHKARLDEVYQLVKEILTTRNLGEHANGG